MVSREQHTGTHQSTICASYRATRVFCPVYDLSSIGNGLLPIGIRSPVYAWPTSIARPSAGIPIDIRSRVHRSPAYRCLAYDLQERGLPSTSIQCTVYISTIWWFLVYGVPGHDLRFTSLRAEALLDMVSRLRSTGLLYTAIRSLAERHTSCRLQEYGLPVGMNLWKQLAIICDLAKGS